jgi:hypothetical protein
MSTRFLIPKLMMFSRFPILAEITFTTAISINFLVNPADAGDPFRSSRLHKIGNRTEAAFKVIFQEGNYPAAEDYLKRAISDEPNEPLAYAIKVALAYGNQDLVTLDKYSKKTLDTGQKLITSNR